MELLSRPFISPTLATLLIDNVADPSNPRNHDP
jgi:hypothetical protein